MTPCSCADACGSEGPKPLSTKKACEALNLHRITLVKYVKAGCPHWKAPGLRGRMTFDLDEVVAWMVQEARSGEPGGDDSQTVHTYAEVAAEKAAGSLGKDSEGRAIDPKHLAGKTGKTPEATPGSELDLSEIHRLTKRVALKLKNLEVQKRERAEEIAEGNLVSVEEITACWVRQIEVVKSAFSTFPGRVAQGLVGQDYDGIYATLKSELDELLRQFASWSPEQEAA